MKGGRFPIKWTAPEAIILHFKFSVKSDVWSFGIALYEIVTYSKAPYSGMPNANVKLLVPQGYRMAPPPLCPSKLYEIMLDCWQEKPATRPTFKTLQQQLEGLEHNITTN